MKRFQRKVKWFINRRVHGKRVMLLCGSLAWELQLGSHVWLWFHDGPYQGKRWLHRIDTFEVSRDRR